MLYGVNSSIIIPTRLRAELLSETLDSLGRQTESDFEVIVVCDGEEPHTRALAERYATSFPLTWIFTAENKGQASARNTGAHAAKGELLLFLDDDTSAAPNWLSWHRKHHNAHSSGNGIAVYGKIAELDLQPPRSHTDRFLREQRDRLQTSFEASLVRAGVESVGVESDRYSCFGLNCSIRRTTFLNSGGFDPVLRYIHEDLEFGNRLYNQGIQFVFEPQAVVYHRDTKDLREYYARCWSLGGRVDVYRVCEKHQRNAQTQGLTLMHSRSAIRRLKASLAWDHPDTLRRIAELSRKMTEATGSKLFFRLWGSLSFTVEYWDGVKAEGITRDSLQQLVGSSLPVLAFHSISVPTCRNERMYCLSPQRFLRFMQRLASARYNCITPIDWLSGTVSARSFMLTFDDGYADFYLEVFPALERFALKPIVFLVVDRIGQTNLWDEVLGYRSRRLLSIEQIREMHRYGVQFGSHTLTHPWLPDLSDADLRREVVDSKARLEDLLGSEVICFAYPSGGVDRRVRRVVAEAGYKIGMTTQEGLNFWGDPLYLNRIEVNETETILSFAYQLATGRSIAGKRKRLRQISRTGLDMLPRPLARILLQTVRTLRSRNS